MSASEHVNETLFHGTSRRFKPGDVVLPASQTGSKQNWGAKSKNDPNLAYATGELESAKYFSAVSALMDTSKASRMRVYQVEPVNHDTATWQNKKFREGSIREHVSPEGYRVVKRAWIGKKDK